MFSRSQSPQNSSADMKAKLEALDRSLAMIEFSPDGKVLFANENFLELLGYSLADIKDREVFMRFHRTCSNLCGKALDLLPPEKMSPTEEVVESKAEHHHV